MKIDILTLFKNSFTPLFESIIGRAVKNNILKIDITDIREFSKDKHKKCDDTPFGGGEGMLMTPQPLFDAINSVRTENSYIVYMSPKGKVFNQQKAKELSNKKHLVFICGHYEGVDQRVIDTFVDEEISIGDYVLTGGELPAMVVVDAVSRFVPDVLGNESSAYNESFKNNLLEFPQYTKPAEFKGQKVPEILLSGNHKQIEKWRVKESFKTTSKVRPDLLTKLINKSTAFKLAKSDAGAIACLIYALNQSEKGKTENGDFFENNIEISNLKKEIVKNFSAFVYFGLKVCDELVGVLKFVKAEHKIDSVFVDESFLNLGVENKLIEEFSVFCDSNNVWHKQSFINLCNLRTQNG